MKRAIPIVLFLIVALSAATVAQEGQKRAAVETRDGGYHKCAGGAASEPRFYPNQRTA